VFQSFPRVIVTAFLLSVASVSSDAQTFTTLAAFNGINGASPLNRNGSSLVQGDDGNFYGTTRSGGLSGNGTVFKLTPDGTLTALYSFMGRFDGSSPTNGLTPGADGNLYGTTPTTIFKITTGGTFTTLYDSTQHPSGPTQFNGLIQARDGNFYGTSSGGAGTVFRITPAGALLVLFTFSAGGPNGAQPVNPLVQGSDGNFYGTTPATVFKMTPSGTLITLNKLSAGVTVAGPLIQATDGNFYGITSGGSASIVFKMIPNGTLITVYTFCAGCPGGSGPGSGLIQGRDGNLYGITGSGAIHNGGAIFQVTLSGRLTALHNFCALGNCLDGGNPEGTLFEASDGTFYGTTAAGGIMNDGTVFSLQLSSGPPGYACSNTTPPAIGSINSASAYGGYPYFASGSWLEIKGTNLADPNNPKLANSTHSDQWTLADFNGSNAPTQLDDISVSINGKPAYVWYVSPTQLNVEAPEDATTASVAITVTNCKATSAQVMFARQALAPGLLAPSNYSSGGTQYMVATFASDGAYVLNTSLGASLGLNSRPAKPGDSIIAYGVGFGDVTPPILPGTIAAQSNSLVNPVAFSFGSTNAMLSYAGLAGSFVGLYEFYITVPAGLADGDYRINVTQNGSSLPQTMYLTVHN
jgi:uncharacterized protein (TIGR03437 family)